MSGIKHKIETTPWDVVRYLETEQDVDRYIKDSWEASIEDNDPEYFLIALQRASRARGILDMAKVVNLPYKVVYEALYDTKKAAASLPASFAQALHLPVPEHA